LTVIIGILCEDGVVVGSDSSATSAINPTVKTIETEALKIEILRGNVITATTGAVGLAQRFYDEADRFFEFIQTPHAPVAAMPTGFPAGMIPQTPLQQVMARVPAGQTPLAALGAVEIGTMLSERVVANFRRTAGIIQNNQGWGLGALVAFANNEPQLLEFEAIQFHPELKGTPDPGRGDRVWRAASMGSGQILADSFLAHAYRLLFATRLPRIDRAKLVVSWALDHVIRYNTGGIGGQQQMAVLEKTAAGDWRAAHLDAGGEMRQAVKDLEDHISNYGREAEQTPIPDAKEELAKDQPPIEPIPAELTALDDSPTLAQD
jgi:hypothetical protein